MPRPRLALVALAALSGCFIDVGPGAGSPDSGSTGAGPTPGTGPATTTESVDAGDSKHSTSDGPEPTTTDATTTTTGPDPTAPTTMSTDPTSPSMPMTSDPVTTDQPGPVCGNGVVETGEACDDANFSNLDDCLADCTPANCSDGYHNQGEVDSDCGGPCPACGPCRNCSDNSGCADGLVCLGGLCNEYHTVEFDWFNDCSVNDAAFVDVPLNYAGPWRVEALGGGGRVTADEAMYGWLAACNGFDLGGLGAPFIHPSAQDAYDAVLPKSIVVDYAGGATKCGLPDTNCEDNAGKSKLGFYLECP